ncbi:MAG TPA: SRPBCC domain-containing protein [Solirubrobacterales bacterium]|nr:SRPBCC domain-containing protein [Solirubrobacterales bacterium]
MPVTDVQKDFDALTMTITAEFEASAERVWQLWADPRQLERWWGPPSYPATFRDHDLTPGGWVTYYMTGPGGDRHHGWWRVEEVEPPNRLRFQDGFGDEDGNPSEEMAPGIAIVTLAEADGRTTMAIESHFTSREDMEKLLEMGQEQGMKEAMGQIDGLLAGAPS